MTSTDWSPSRTELAFYRGMLAATVAATAAFTIYGSLVPFQFRDGDPPQFSVFVHSMKRWRQVESRSDALANALLGIPLGFGLLGLLRAHSKSRIADISFTGLVLPACLLFSCGVEYSQLFTLSRTCSGSDVLFQGLGAAAGMAAWILAGRWILRWTRTAWTEANPSARFLAGYVVLLAFIQLLPMDLSASPRELYHKLRDHVVYEPFSEFKGADDLKVWSRSTRLLQVFALYLPIGLFAAGISRRAAWFGSLGKRAAQAVAVAGIMEMMQLVVQSRVTSATAVLVGAFGCLAGYELRIRWTPLAGRVSALAWLSMMLMGGWQPFQLLANAPRSFGWMPGLPLETGDPMFALEEMLTKAVLFALGGALAGGTRSAAIAGTAVAALIEAGQTVVASHSPGITDVMLGTAGAVVGSAIRRRSSA